jgi:hypothetical protein
MVEARCPVCGKVFNVTDGQNRWAVEGLFLKHKDTCRLPEPGEFVKVVTQVAVVVSVDVGSEEWPVVEVRFPSGRTGAYGFSTRGRVTDQAGAAERFRRMVSGARE